MTCEEFRHQLSIDPHCGATAFREHACACSACARVREKALRFEESLRAALAAELSAAEEPGLRRHGPFRSSILYALVFTPLLMAAFWLVLRGGIGTDWDGDPAAAVIGHIQAEEEHLRAEGAIPWASVQRLFGTLGAVADPRLGPVRFAGRCVIGARYGIHLVLPGERGAVTALFMPGNDLPEKRGVAGGGFEGILLPAGSGSLALVGEPGEPLEPIARRLLVAVRWNRAKF